MALACGVQDKTLTSMACQALGYMAYIAPDAVLPLIYQRFEVCAHCWLLVSGWLRGLALPMPSMDAWHITHALSHPVCVSVTCKRAQQMEPACGLPQHLPVPQGSLPPLMLVDPQDALENVTAAHQLVAAVTALTACVRPMLLAGLPQLDGTNGTGPADMAVDGSAGKSWWHVVHACYGTLLAQLLRCLQGRLGPSAPHHIL